MKKITKRLLSGLLSIFMMLSIMPGIKAANTVEVKSLYNKGNFVKSYNPIKDRYTDSKSRTWRNGMVSGNREIGYITSGEPYNDSFIFQHMYFNYPSSQTREIPNELTGQLEDARLNVFTANAAMDISAARDGLDMVDTMEKAVNGDAADKNIKKWTD